ncbi:stealth family protein [Actinorugispora endophytica]|uniref:Stealth-like protein n=1 Tax=Actinorugispora endophytica TaxID=1605990 RepID=A0A4R6UZG6_9ACTN|nr:stealth family protein [Actinorugispora endophytica]TDQ51413.1 Stealth-like protein [Actinorugispora endophytica]
MGVSRRARRALERLLPPARRAALAEERRLAAEAAAERKRLERVAARRRELLDSDPATRRIEHRGEEAVGRVVERFTASGAAEHNLSLVVRALEHAGVDHFLVPVRTPVRYALGVHRDDRKRLLDAMRELYGGTALYAARSRAEGVPVTGSLYADGALPKEVRTSGVIRFGELLLGPAGQLLGGLEFGCDVEFWQDGAKVLESPSAPTRLARLRVQVPPDIIADSLVAPRRNPVADVLPAGARKPVTRRVAGMSLPAFEVFERPRIDDVDFPIDVVYTWVDGTDPELARKRESYRPGAARISARETGASRYTSHDELKYSLRSLQTYAEFVRHVYVVTDGQAPSWLDPDAPGLTVVDHTDLFTDPGALPVFNSHAIGTQLHHIDGLSERYLYFNDDVFVGRPIQPQAFFHGNGIARIPFSPYQYGVGEPHPEEAAPNSAGKNVRELLLDSHGRFITHKFKHTPHPQLRSVMRELEERFAEDVERTSRSRFRATTDIAMAASLHHHYAFLTGRAVAGEFSFCYVDTGLDTAEERLAKLEAERGFDLFCLNDVSMDESARERTAERLHRFLEAYFPYPSSFERRSPDAR